MSSSCVTYCDDVLGYLDATALLEKLRRKEISLSEVCTAVIERARKSNPTLNAYTSEHFDLPIKHQTNTGAFLGLPLFIKDNLPVKGFYTGFGSQAVAPRLEKWSDPYVRQLEKMGFSFIGKSALPEFGLNATTEHANSPPTPNPWNIAHSCGASSGGAAALVASGVVPIAHGNDGGGSIRIPAACCGLVGLKPSRGRHVNSLAARALPINILSEGVLTRSVRDTALFHYESEKIYRNHRLTPLSQALSPPRKRLRVGVIFESLVGLPIDPDVNQAVSNCAIHLSKLGHDVHEIPFPVTKKFADDFTLYWSLMAFLIKRSGKLAIGKKFDPNGMDDFSNGLAEFYRHQILKTPASLIRLKKQGQSSLRTFDDVDVILSPTLNHAPPPLGYLSPQVHFETLFERLRNYVGFTPLANVSGAPAISLPLALSRESLPIGLQFMANLGREDLLLSLAYELEQTMGWPHLDTALT